MNRLQKKCFVASAGLHLLLVLILLVGPAFLASKSRMDDMPVLDFIPSKLIDANAMGGGNPKATPPPPAPPATPTPAPPEPITAKPAREKQREPDPPVVKAKLDPDSLEVNTKPKKREIVLTPVKRRTPTKPNPTQTAANDAQQRQAVEAQRRVAEAIGSATQILRSGFSTTMSVESDYGPVGGGPSYANYEQLLKSIYQHAWLPPEDTATDEAITRVTVTIAKDGRVVSSRILRGCGVSSVDRSVQRTLDRVTFIAPFPEGAKESERTYTINFNLKAKRLLG